VTSKELYSMCLAKRRIPKTFSGLSVRAFNILKSANITSREQMLGAIESGEIMRVRNMGKATLKEMCEWICKEDTNGK